MSEFVGHPYRQARTIQNNCCGAEFERLYGYTDLFYGRVSEAFGQIGWHQDHQLVAWRAFKRSYDELPFATGYDVRREAGRYLELDYQWTLMGVKPCILAFAKAES